MVKLLRTGNNGEIIVQTDAKDWEDFCSQLATALESAVGSFEGDYEYRFREVLLNAMPIAFKLANINYKDDKLHEARFLTCGYAKPSECELVGECK